MIRGLSSGGHFVLARVLIAVALSSAALGATIFLLGQNILSASRHQAVTLVCAELMNIAVHPLGQASNGVEERIAAPNPTGVVYAWSRPGSAAIGSPPPVGKPLAAHDPLCDRVLAESRDRGAPADHYELRLLHGRAGATGRSYVIGVLERDLNGAPERIQVGVPEPDAVRLLQVTAAIAAALILGLAVLGVRTDTVFRRRVAALNQVFDRLGEGEIAARPGPDGTNDELSALGRHIAASLDELDRHVAAVRRVVDYVAHELRRPLSHMSLKAQRARRAPAARSSQLLTEVEADIAALSAACDGLLDLGRMANHAPVAVDFSDLVDSAAEAFMAAAAAKGVAIVGDVAAGVFVLGEPAQLSALVHNLIENAVKYTDAGRVEVRLSAIGDRFRLEIEDSGGGMTAEELERLGQAFERGAQVGETPGHGIGLALCEHIARRHGFHMVRSNAAAGLRVDITGPRDASIG